MGLSAPLNFLLPAKKALEQVVSATSALTPVEGDKVVPGGSATLMRYDSGTGSSASADDRVLSSATSFSSSTSSGSGSGSSEASDGTFSRSVSKDFPDEASTPQTAGEREELRKLFQSVDADGDGKICRTELAGFLANLKLDAGVSDAEIHALLKAADENGDGKLEFEEFLNLHLSLTADEDRGSGAAGTGRAGEDDDDDQGLRDAFSVFDSNNDGFISANELLLVLQSLSGKCTKKLSDCAHMIKAVDKDGDGRVNFEEFKQMMATGFQ